MTPDSSPAAPESWLGWHFLRASCRLTNAPQMLVYAGQTLALPPSQPLALCEWGYHASARALDALRYAPGPIVCRVELLGERLDDDDKSCARGRRCLWMADATTTLHEFALWHGEDALLRERAVGREPDAKLWAVLDAKRQWLRGECSTDALIIARTAARDVAEAAWSAAGIAGSTAEAAWAAARAARTAWTARPAAEAAWAAARAAGSAAEAAWDVAEAAWDVAEIAGTDAVRAAATVRGVVWTATRAARNERLTAMLMALAPHAAA